MQLTRLSRVFIEGLAEEQLPAPLLDYGSPSGEIATALQGEFADHRVNNCFTGKGYYVERAVDLPRSFATIVLTAQFESALNSQLTRELLSMLSPSGQLFVLLPAGYTLKPFQELGLPWVMKLSSPDGQLLQFERPEGLLEVTGRQTCYDILAGEKVLNLCAGPGVFSGDNIDKGTQALLKALNWTGGKVLDLGCGNGILGLYAASMGAEAVTMIDVDLRAILCARENALRNGVQVQTLATDDLSTLPDNYYALIISNPPYHSDYKVARVFIEEGFRKLVVKGSMWMVVKNADWYSNKMRKIFGGVSVFEQDGYKIVHAEKRTSAGTSAKEKDQKTTRKHAKKLSTNKKRRR